MDSNYESLAWEATTVPTKNLFIAYVLTGPVH